MTKISERDATEVPVQPQVIQLKELSSSVYTYCPFFLTYIQKFNHFKFQIFNHFTFEVFILGNVFTKGIIFIQFIIRDKIWGKYSKKKVLNTKKHVNLVS